MTLRALTADRGNLLERRDSDSNLGNSSKHSLSLAQIKMDQTGEHFLQGLTDTKTMGCLFLGTLASQAAKFAVADFTSSNVAIRGVGLFAETAALKGAESLASGNKIGQSYEAKAFLATAMNLGLLRGLGEAFASHNPVFTHLLQSGAMALGDEVGSRFGLAPQGISFLERVMNAELMNLQMSANMALWGSLTSSRFEVRERELKARMEAAAAKVHPPRADFQALPRFSASPKTAKLEPTPLPPQPTFRHVDAEGNARRSYEMPEHIIPLTNGMPYELRVEIGNGSTAAAITLVGKPQASGPDTWILMHGASTLNVRGGETTKRMDGGPYPVWFKAPGGSPRKLDGKFEVIEPGTEIYVGHLDPRLVQVRWSRFTPLTPPAAAAPLPTASVPVGYALTLQRSEWNPFTGRDDLVTHIYFDPSHPRADYTYADGSPSPILFTIQFASSGTSTRAQIFHGERGRVVNPLFRLTVEGFDLNAGTIRPVENMDRIVYGGKTFIVHFEKPD